MNSVQKQSQRLSYFTFFGLRSPRPKKAPLFENAPDLTLAEAERWLDWLENQGCKNPGACLAERTVTGHWKPNTPK